MELTSLPSRTQAPTSSDCVVDANADVVVQCDAEEVNALRIFDAVIEEYDC